MSRIPDDAIVIAADHAGFEVKQSIVEMLRKRGVPVVDLGCDSPSSVDYPDYAHRLCATIERGEHRHGILVCGSGQGMAMAANKHQGIRAALCPNPEFAKLSRLHNDSNVLCLAARLTPPAQIPEIVDSWLETSFEGGRHQGRVDKIDCCTGED